MRALVVVLGDLGRSPRMLAHAGSLLRAGYAVDLVGGGETPLPALLREHPQLSVHHLALGRSGRGAGPTAVLATAVRGLKLTWQLSLRVLRDTPAPDLILVQNPPALPTLAVAALAARVYGARLIIDWHNFGWSVLSLRFGHSSLVVTVARAAELFLGRFAQHHLAVSQRQANVLASMGITGAVALHDGPSAVRPFPAATSGLPAQPLTVVAPMSWSRDDDLPLLEQALIILKSRAKVDAAPPQRLRVRVSGNGPLRESWGPRLRALSDAWVSVETPDVPTDEYPRLLADSHVGLSLHRSASGLDLPMKVMELRAVGLPTLTLEDDSPLDEIAPPGCGVIRYRSATDLADLLEPAMDETSEAPGMLARARRESQTQRPVSWEDRWDAVMVTLQVPGA